MKHKFKSDYGLGDVFKYYEEKFGNKYNVSSRNFVQTCAKLNQAVVNMMIYDKREFYFPANLGGWRIKRRKTKFKLDDSGELKTTNLPVDYQATKKLWAEDPKAKKEKRLIFIFNDHTDGYRFRFWWDKSTCRVKNQSRYYIKPSRYNSRLLAKAVKDPSQTLDFYE